MMNVLRVLIVIGVVGQAFAAPVPKNLESQADKIKRLFGEAVTDNDTKLEIVGKDSLRITLNKNYPKREPGQFEKVSPLIAKEVEGDFILTVRMNIVVDQTAAKAEGSKVQALTAGIAMTGEARDYMLYSIVQSKNAKEWRTGFNYLQMSANGGSQSTSSEKFNDKPRYIRVIRKDDMVSVQIGDDLKKLKDQLSTGQKFTNQSLKIGFVLFHSTEGECVAEFDQYEIKVLPVKDEKKETEKKK